jgi:hypothetical protein
VASSGLKTSGGTTPSISRQSTTQDASGERRMAVRTKVLRKGLIVFIIDVDLIPR